MIEQANQVWAADITYVPIGRGFLYLVAIMDWASRAVLAWRLSNTLDADVCVRALEEALARFGAPEIFNTDQGSQFTSTAFTAVLQRAGVRISMDGRGRWLDNVFIERLWRSLKYEEVYLKSYADGREARAGIAAWIVFYNATRPHQALDGSAYLRLSPQRDVAGGQPRRPPLEAKGIRVGSFAGGFGGGGGPASTQDLRCASPKACAIGRAFSFPGSLSRLAPGPPRL